MDSPSRRGSLITRCSGGHADAVGFVFQFFKLLLSFTALENVERVAEIAVNPISAREALGRGSVSPIG